MRISAPTGPLPIAKSSKRSALGCMTDMAFLCEHEIVRSGTVARTDIRSLNRHLRRNINSTREQAWPIDLIERTAL